MSELLVRVVSKTNPGDIYLDCQLTKRGDVISVCADGHPWSAAELTAPYWRIFKVPQLSIAEAEAFLEPERPIDEFDLRKTLQRRAFKLDVDNAALPADLKSYILDDSRVRASYTITLTKAQVNALKIVKAPIADPVFG